MSWVLLYIKLIKNWKKMKYDFGRHQRIFDIFYSSASAKMSVELPSNYLRVTIYEVSHLGQIN